MTWTLAAIRKANTDAGYNFFSRGGLYGYSTDRACAKAIARALKQKFSDALLLVAPYKEEEVS